MPSYKIMNGNQATPLIVHEDASQLQVATAMPPEFACYYETGQQVV